MGQILTKTQVFKTAHELGLVLSLRHHEDPNCEIGVLAPFGKCLDQVDLVANRVWDVGSPDGNPDLFEVRSTSRDGDAFLDLLADD